MESRSFSWKNQGIPFVSSPKGRIQALPGIWMQNEAHIFPAMLFLESNGGDRGGNKPQGTGIINSEEREPSKQDGVWIKSETAVGVFPQGNADTICRAGDRLQGPTD